MAGEEDKINDFYGVLGLEKECSSAELRIAYKKLALKWHPDRFSASGNSKYLGVANKKFQAIQQAYSVLSNADKRILYDIGLYDSNDDDDGMGEFLNEMTTMMSQTTSNEKGYETLEELQQLFDEMFQSDIESFSGSSLSSMPPTRSSSSSGSFIETYSSSNGMSSGDFSSGHANFEGFCFGTGGTMGRNEGGESNRRKITRKSRR
ncbi:hypothetical protein CASFOL_025078 [Castilleja foliolosa]|uniref:J domain-containing protein n=1 Tax=Castilleja foliolosa TaxID=1961234 RepID=A0ABD3CSD0_9LAMI